MRCARVTGTALRVAAAWLACASAVCAPASAAPAATQRAGAPRERNDYANARFAQPLTAGLKSFYARDFASAQQAFERALASVPDNTLALAFVAASATQRPGALDALVNGAEDAVTAAPKNYAAHVRLGFAYMFASLAGRDRGQDAREEFAAALALEPRGAAVHDGLGILRFNERSAHRSKTELLQALQVDPADVLAREYLAELYQMDLRDPRRGLAYLMPVPSLVPQYADAYFHIGSLLHDLQQPELALQYLRQGLALDTGRAGEAGRHGATLVARILIEQHRLGEATAVLNAALADDVDAIYAKTLLAKIKAGDYASAPSPGPQR